MNITDVFKYLSWSGAARAPCSHCVPTRRAGEAQWHRNSPERSEVQGCNVSKAVGENQSNSYLGKYPHPDDFVPAGEAEGKS